MRLKLVSIALRQSFLYIVISSACTKYGYYGYRIPILSFVLAGLFPVSITRCAARYCAGREGRT